MKFKDLGFSNSLLWFLISIFLFFWLGIQLVEAFSNLEIQNLRSTDLVSFENSPIWFIFVTAFKVSFWVFSVLLIYNYVQAKFKKNT